MNASVTLTAAASKRLIARGIAAHQSVQKAMREGRVVITLGTTNAFVAEELLGTSVDRSAYAAGFIDTHWNLNARLGEAQEVVLERGRRVNWEPERVLSSLVAGDVLIKGGNALDPWGIVGVLMAAQNGGTIGRYVPTALARGVEILIPISLSKSIHASVIDLSQEMGTGRTELHSGLACGMYPLHGQVVTEIEALRLLADVDAAHVTSNGVGCGRGGISLFLYGERPAVERAFGLINDLAGETDVELLGKV